MIIDIPEPNDFFVSGWRFLDYGWSQAIGLLINVKTSEDDYQPTSTEIEEFWELGRPHLVTSLALVQQGIELLLKGCIAEVSPYLLISDSRSWKNEFSQSDTPFSEFYTIDAQHLIKVYDTVRKQRLSKEFKTRFDELKKHRNSAFHSVSKSITVEAVQILLAVFEAVENLTSRKRWLEIHKGFLAQNPISPFTPLEYDVRSQMMKEMEIIVENFVPKDVEKYTGFRIQERAYRCPLCERAANKRGGKPSFAQVVMDETGTTESLYCFCCYEDLTDLEYVEVVEVSCQSSKCDSKFVDVYGICLACGYRNELDD